MLAELSEDAAQGPIAEIYGEIRRLWAVPYVSSLQRHLATRPGWLEWAWAALGPAFLSGQAQTASWRVAADLDLPTLQPLTTAALRNLGVAAADEKVIAEVCAGFVRVAPVNLMFSGLLRRLLNGERPAGPSPAAVIWQPPKVLPALPRLVDIAAADADLRAVLLQLGTDVDGTPFVPGLYLILARWPDYIAHLAGVLAPLGAAPEMAAARAALLAGIDRAVAELFPTLPALPALPGGGMPAADEFPAVLAALDMYRRTSPEMVIFGRLIAGALR